MALVQAAYDGVKTTNQIAEELGLSRGYVYTTILRLELKPVTKRKYLKAQGRPPPPDNTKILAFSASPEAINRYLARAK